MNNQKYSKEQFDLMLNNVLLVNPKWRYGQGLFNLAAMLQNKLAEKVRATDLDPFYATGVEDIRVSNFIEFLEENDFFEKS